MDTPPVGRGGGATPCDSSQPHDDPTGLPCGEVSEGTGSTSSCGSTSSNPNPNPNNKMGHNDDGTNKPPKDTKTGPHGKWSVEAAVPAASLGLVEGARVRFKNVASGKFVRVHGGSVDATGGKIAVGLALPYRGVAWLLLGDASAEPSSSSCRCEVQSLASLCCCCLLLLLLQSPVASRQSPVAAETMPAL